MIRGNDGQIIFQDEADRNHMAALLEKSVREFNCVIHAFCFMNNHIHLLIEVKDIPLGKIIQDIARRYVLSYNHRLKRIGHLFQGRYKAILITKNPYLLEVCRYIHLNPVRAYMVEKASDYPWSSHNDYFGQKHFSWVTTTHLLSYFSENNEIAIKSYAKFMESQKAYPIELML